MSIEIVLPGLYGARVKGPLTLTGSGEGRFSAPEDPRSGRFALLTDRAGRTSVPAMMRKVSITGWKRAVLTALMAYALVLQTLLASLGAAAHAADAAGPQGVLCLPASSSRPDQAPAKAHDGLCCTLSCHGKGPAGPAPDVASVERLSPVAPDPHIPAASPAVRHFSNVLPVGSRAPPRLG